MDTVDDILAALQDLPPDRLQLMRAVWEQGDAGIRQDAWLTSKAAFDEAQLRALEAANGAVAGWVAAFAAGRTGTPYDPNWGMDRMRLDARIAATPPILDAILAAVAGPALATEVHEELVAPWEAALATDA
jgi:hypothetical protein